MVRPAVCREAVGLVQAELKLSERQACLALGVSRSSLRYQSVRPIPTRLIARIKELAGQRPRWGYRKLWELLKRDGEKVNHKRVYRLYRAEGLMVRTKRRRRLAAAPRVVRPEPTRPNQRWSMDFVSDVTANGKRFRIFTLIDDFSRKAIAALVGTSFSGVRLARLLDSLGGMHGLPSVLVCDNGPEFTSNALDQWAHKNKVTLSFIRPGKPIENAFVESFNGRLRDECLNVQWFTDVQHAADIVEAWKHDYNNVRPHSSLDGQTPSEYERAFTQGLTQRVA